jgi:tetratricopeptide (TPR) repeat protein
MQDMVFIYLLHGHLIDAENYAKMCIQLSREYGNISYIWVGLRRLGLVLMASGRYNEADASLHESMDITTNVDDPYEIGTASIRLAQARLHLGRYSDTVNLATECLKSARKLGTQRNISFNFILLGRLALVNEEFQKSITLVQQGIDILEGMGSRRELGPAYADLCLSSMRLGNTTEAKQYLKTALEYAVKTGDYVAHVYVLPIVALYFANQDQIDKADELYSLAVSYPMVANSHWFADIFGNTFRTISPHSIVENLDATHAETHISELQSTVNHLLQEVTSPPA